VEDGLKEWVRQGLSGATDEVPWQAD
jgi:hypothetical protein